MEALGEDVFGENDQMFDKLTKNFSSLLGSSKNSHSCTKFKQID
jgi:hypothetical protein